MRCKKKKDVEFYVISKFRFQLREWASDRKREMKWATKDFISHLISCNQCLNEYIKVKKKSFFISLMVTVNVLEIIDFYLKVDLDNMVVRNDIARKIWLKEEEGNGKNWDEYVQSLIEKKKKTKEYKNSEENKINYLHVCEDFDKFYLERILKNLEYDKDTSDWHISFFPFRSRFVCLS